jgi:hypothetical protein
MALQVEMWRELVEECVIRFVKRWLIGIRILKCSLSVIVEIEEECACDCDFVSEKMREREREGTCLCYSPQKEKRKDLLLPWLRLALSLYLLTKISKNC